MSSSKIYPKQCEIWKINLDPTLGSEMKKTRPVIIISNSIVNKSSLRIVVPLTGYKPDDDQWDWKIKITPDNINGLTKDSVVDALNIRSVSLDRFQQKLGVISVDKLLEIQNAVTMIIEEI
ncbi:MAG: type II toxin-antitoxin system PemK/MazF family toxin [Ignavibacteriales bacterium]|nr:MAG: type II toxin-antitoxin system PemK/MazF family toxin [Ignavibacteriaceae bacterium]MBW7873496.1 type II toxin-antitoxin system PemK/MazF family toxin [Ignavibacteria bacterium]MCZ2142187.1 type II toxin-antitoxin system PemK/MazF family toxin [Ignavibacteriales bacterium]MBV6444922.1 Endoribonuclease MazF9 [Ignavibacteriaceae bacterium]MBZ0196711.1 type II toxin-antitoxin system PemK/MazF family toxin [Ignavibacteriaceae bacterium]